MDWITDRIAIGNYVDATDPDLLQKAGFKSILCLDCNIAPPKLAGLTRRVVHLIDEPINQFDEFLKAIVTLEELAINSHPVLVHCHAGRSRSVIVVAGFLMRALRCSPEEALAKVSAKRQISITPGLEQWLHHI
jgi:protein tyrosine phosphatase (PTP) superfamily phosphohydrolase (DUF442 family)